VLQAKRAALGGEKEERNETGEVRERRHIVSNGSGCAEVQARALARGSIAVAELSNRHPDER
jgi:hypothetical protein